MPNTTLIPAWMPKRQEPFYDEIILASVEVYEQFVYWSSLERYNVQLLH